MDKRRKRMTGRLVSVSLAAALALSLLPASALGVYAEEEQRQAMAGAGADAPGEAQPAGQEMLPGEAQSEELETLPGGTQPVEQETLPGETQPTEAETLPGGTQPEEPGTLPGGTQPEEPGTLPGGTQPEEPGTLPGEPQPEEPGTLPEEGQGQPAGPGVQAAGPEGQESVEGKTEPEELEEGQKPEDGMQGTDGKTPENGQGSEPGLTGEEVQPEETVEGTGGAEIRTFMLPQEVGEESIMPLAGKYDIDKPVIESFEFVENGQTLTVDDTLHFTMSAYDADSGIQSIYVYISCSDSYGSTSFMTFGKSGEGNLYVGELPCSELKGNHFYVSHIRVQDNAQNYVDWDTGKDGESLYTFTLDNEIDVNENVSVSNFQMDADPSNEDGKLRTGDAVTYTADAVCKDEEIRNVNMCLEAYANDCWKSEYITMDYSKDTHKLTGTYTVTDKTYPAEWRLDYIYVDTEAGKSYYFYPSQIEPDTNLTFEVAQDDYDTKKPVIESITIDKNGEWVAAGDVIHITVKVSEENPSEYASAYFYPQVTNVSASRYVNLKLNADSKEYTGTIEITENTYPCEWALTQLNIHDEVGHQTGLYDFKSDWQNTYPWYFKVKQDTYREDEKNVTFEFYGYTEQEDGSFQFGLISAQEIKVGRRATLKDLGVSFPQDMEGIQEWRYGKPDQLEGEGYGTVVDENAEILFNSTSDMDYPMTAIYGKGCANVSLTYMSKEDGQTSKMIPMFVDKEATYKDVLNALELPEDAQTDGFAGFKLSHSDEGHNEGSRVGQLSYISAEAQYNNCQIAWNTRYIGKDGKEASRIVMKSYLDGTNISDALAGLDGPEGAGGMEFEAWVLASPDGIGTITRPMANLDVVAVYRGKTTVDASYIYRGEDGAIASEGRLMLLEGEGLSSAAVQEEAREVFKNVSHLKGLMLSEWTSAVKVDQDRYKGIQFRALYDNCVATLKYPDNTCQYIVVDKGAEFTLPTENDKYWDITWAGYGKGATVVINEDTEFTAEEFKDGAKEETNKNDGDNDKNDDDKGGGDNDKNDDDGGGGDNDKNDGDGGGGDNDRNGEDNGTAAMEKDPGHTAAGPNAGKDGNPGSGRMKSPKTGE